MPHKIENEFGDNPLVIFQNWFGEAGKHEPADANAMALATVDEQNRPSVRIVLLKSFDERGFVFFTNFGSGKGLALQKNRYAELNFYWKSTDKQIRISGPVEKTTDTETDEYFASRPRESQVGAWASAQTKPMNDYDNLKKQFDEMEKKFAGKNIPRPPHWGGFRVIPERMEFWLEQPARLHKRFVFVKKGNIWESTWLFP